MRTILTLLTFVALSIQAATKQPIIALLLFALTSTAQKSPNFLIVLTDDQAWAGTSCLMDPANPDSKSDYYRTPNMDSLLQRGMRFSNGYASGAWCAPSRRCIQVGQSTSRHIYNKAADENEGTYATLTTMPRVLKSINPDYQCAHFGKWHLKYSTVTPETLGYDVSDGDSDNGTGEWANQPGGGPATSKDTPDVCDDPKTVFDLSKRTGDFIEANHKAGKPWMVQLSEYAVHLKIAYRQETFDKIVPRPKGKKHALPEYAAMTEDLDEAIGVLMDRLKKLGALDNTYVIYLSDNGGRGKMPIAGQAEHVSDQNRNYPLAGAKHSIYEGGLRVPFSISGPGIQAGSISHVPVSGVDILPTVADFAGYHKPFGAAVDGGSFKTIALATGDTVSREHPLVFHSEGGERPRNAQATKKDDKPIKQRFARAPTNW